MAKHSRQPLRSSQKKKWLTILRSSAVKKKIGDSDLQPLRIVVDTNIWYSAVVHGGKAEAALLYCMDNAEIVLSAEITDELYDLLRNFLKVPYRWLNAFMRLLEDVCEIIPHENASATVETDIRDPKDMHVVAAALSSGAHAILTGDKDLLTLNSESLLIINSADFAELIK